jgi:hypothetical protein
MTRNAVAALLTLICAPAMAQPASNARATCDNLLKPAYESVEDFRKQNLTADCSCMTSFVTGRFGAEDGEIILRLFSAFSSESEEKVKATIQGLGQDKFRTLMAKVGKFQDVGRDMDKACPPVKKS